MTDRKRRLKGSWLEGYRKYIVKQESPDAFHFWVGVTMISSVLKRHVYVDRDAYIVLPNIYTFLVAKSGRCRKSAAMDIGMDLVREIEEIHTIHGRMTVEGLIDTMDRASADPLGRVKPDGSVLIQADELSYMFGRASYITDLMSFLTAAFTGRARLDFLTRGAGLRKVRNPCPVILAGTTPENMGEIFPSMSLASGFMARVLLIYSDQYYRVAKPKLDRSMEEDLINDLGCINQLCGEMRLTEEADSIFDLWYENMSPPKYSELASFFERKHDHVLKVAAILSVAESDELVIEKYHLLSAIRAIEGVEETIPSAIAYVGATHQSSTADMIEAIVMSMAPERVSHSVLLRRVYKRLTSGASEFESIIKGLVESNRIKDIATERGTFYELGRSMQKLYGGIKRGDDKS